MIRVRAIPASYFNPWTFRWDLFNHTIPEWYPVGARTRNGLRLAQESNTMASTERPIVIHSP